MSRYRFPAAIRCSIVSTMSALCYLGGTRDDAAGEAFDKVAKIIGLGYPAGGRSISWRKAATKGASGFRARVGERAATSLARRDQDRSRALSQIPRRRSVGK